MSFFPAAQLAVAVAQPEPIQPLDDDVIEVFSAAFQILDWQDRLEAACFTVNVIDTITSRSIYAPSAIAIRPDSTSSTGASARCIH